MHRFARFVVRRRVLVLASLTAFTLFLGSGILRLYVEVDPDRQLPQHHPYIETLNETHRLFGDKNLVVIGIQALDGNAFSPQLLSKIDEITAKLADLPGIAPPLLQSIASPAVKDIRLDGDQLIVEPFMVRRPITPTIAREIKNRALDNPSTVGTIVSRDASALAIYATFELSPALPGYVNLHRAVEQIVAAADDGTFRYAISGVVAVSAALSTHASRMGLFFPIALFAIGVVHYHAFRTWQAVVLPLGTGMLAVVWAMGLMGHLSIPLDPFNATTPVLILAVGAGHAVQILKRYYEELAVSATNEDAVIASLIHVGPVMIAAATIASLSFFSLATLGTESIRTFGTFTGLGIVSVLAIELTAIPAIRTALGTPKTANRTAEASTAPWLDSILDATAHRLLLPKWARTSLLAYTLLLIACAYLSRWIVVDTSLKRSFSPADPVLIADDWLNDLFAGTNTLLFLVEGPTEGALTDPAALRGIERFEQRMEAIGGVGKAFSFVDTVKRLHRTLAPDSGLSGIPQDRAAISEYLFLYSLSGGSHLATLLTPDNRIAKVTVMLHDDSTNYGERVIGHARRIANETLPVGFRMRVAGTLASNAALTQSIVRGKLLNIAQVTLLTIVVSAIILRSAVAGCLVAVPLAVAVLVNFGVMGVLGIRLDIATAAVTAMAVGIGADYAVYFLFRLREETARMATFESALVRSMKTSGKAVLFVSTAVAIGYSVLCLSGFRVFEQLGFLVALAMVSSSVATLVAIPAMLTLISRTHWVDSVLGNVPARDTSHESHRHRSAS